MNNQKTANNILVDLDAESQRDLLGDPGTNRRRAGWVHACGRD